LFLKYYGFFNIYFCCFVFLCFVILCWDLLTFFFCNLKNYIFHGLVSVSYPNWAWNRRNWKWGHPSFWCNFFLIGNWRLCCLKILMEKIWKRLASCNHGKSVSVVQSNWRLCFLRNGFGWGFSLREQKRQLKKQLFKCMGFLTSFLVIPIITKKMFGWVMGWG